MKRKRKWEDDDPHQLLLFEILPAPVGQVPWYLIQAILQQKEVELEEIEREHSIMLNPDYFDYPNTDAPFGDGKITIRSWPKIGLLHDVGYVVGLNGKARSQRQAILTRVFELRVIPNLVSAEYVADWGSACSSARLRKLAYSIAAFCKNAKRRQQKLGTFLKHAIENWEDDLAWLKIQYYDGQFDNKFLWPHC